MAAHDHETRSGSQAFLLAVATALAIGCGAAGIADQAAALGPNVGDIISFNSSRPALTGADARLVVTRPGQGDCVLDLDTIRRMGGESCS